MDKVTHFARVNRVAKLMHPNLITLYDVGSIGQRVYFVEEYMPGAELSVLLMQQGRLSVSRASHVLRQAVLRRGAHLTGNRVRISVA